MRWSFHMTPFNDLSWSFTSFIQQTWNRHCTFSFFWEKHLFWWHPAPEKCAVVDDLLPEKVLQKEGLLKKSTFEKESCKSLSVHKYFLTRNQLGFHSWKTPKACAWYKVFCSPDQPYFLSQGLKWWRHDQFARNGSVAMNMKRYSSFKEGQLGRRFVCSLKWPVMYGQHKSC